MIKKATRVNVEEYAIEKGLTPIQVDGIPEGFSFKENDINIGGIDVVGSYIAFIPLSMWISVRADSVEKLIEIYNKVSI